MFLGLPDPDPLVRDMEPDPDPYIHMFLGLPDPDPLVRDMDPGVWECGKRNDVSGGSGKKIVGNLAKGIFKAKIYMWSKTTVMYKIA
jgi:hypothetical protein